jgi:hypothetical protein
MSLQGTYNPPSAPPPPTISSRRQVPGGGNGAGPPHENWSNKTKKNRPPDPPNIDINPSAPMGDILIRYINIIGKNLQGVRKN